MPRDAILDVHTGSLFVNNLTKSRLRLIFLQNFLGSPLLVRGGTPSFSCPPPSFRRPLGYRCAFFKGYSWPSKRCCFAGSYFPVFKKRKDEQAHICLRMNDTSPSTFDNGQCNQTVQYSWPGAEVEKPIGDKECVRNILGVKQSSWPRAGVESPCPDMCRSRESYIRGGVAQKWAHGVVVVVIGVNLSVPTGGVCFY